MIDRNLFKSISTCTTEGMFMAIPFLAIVLLVNAVVLAIDWLKAHGITSFIAHAAFVIVIAAFVYGIILGFLEWRKDNEQKRVEELAQQLHKAIAEAANTSRMRTSLEGLLDVFVDPAEQDIWGQRFMNWREKLDEMVKYGLDLRTDNPNRERLIKALQRSIDYNRERVEMSEDSSLDGRQRINFALAQLDINRAKECLAYLKTKLEASTAPAAESQSRPITSL